MKKLGLILDFLFSISFIVNAQWVEGNNIPGNSNTYFLSVAFVNYQQGWISGNNGVIFHTSDAGLTWIQQNSNTIKNLRRIRFTNINNGWAVGDSGIIIHTSDGGNSWILQQNSFNYTLLDIAEIDSEYCWITGYNGLVLNTTDGGISWNSEHSISGPWLMYSVQFLNRSIGWV